MLSYILYGSSKYLLCTLGAFTVTSNTDHVIVFAVVTDWQKHSWLVGFVYFSSDTFLVCFSFILRFYTRLQNLVVSCAVVGCISHCADCSFSFYKRENEEKSG